MLVGGGADLPILQTLANQLGIEAGCCFVGRVSPKVAPFFFQLADLTVDPVHDDLPAQARWPLKIVESLAAGVPVVTGAVGDRAEMLGGGTAGRLVAPGDTEALARAIAELLTNPDLHDEMRAACLIQAQKYESAALTEQLERFYLSLREPR